MELEVKIENGIVKVNKWQEYYRLAEPMANEICKNLYGDYQRNEWLVIVKGIMTELANKSNGLKSKILTDVSYSLYIHEASTEAVKMPFKEAKAYVEGYNNATRRFNEVFNKIEDCFKVSLDKFLPH